MKKLLIVLLLIGLASCTLIQNRKEKIINKELTLIPSKPLPKNQKIPYIVIKADGRVSGNAGCNRIIGFAVFGNAGEIMFKQMATTKMLCPSLEGSYESNDIEAKFLNALNQTLFFEITQDNNTLYLIDKNKNPLVMLKIKN